MSPEVSGRRTGPGTVLAFTIAERAYVMETGRVRLQGSPAELSQDEAIVRTYRGG